MDLTVSVTKSFSSFDLSVDFSITDGKVGLFGPSGSGKSTLVSLIAGLQKPDSGVIRLDGKTLNDGGTITAPECRGIGLIFQRPHLFPHLSVRGNLLYGYHRRAAHERKVDFDSLVEVLKIGHLLERGVNRLSGGEQQRVAIGRAVLSNPRLLLMDEPLSALDDTLRFQIMQYLRIVCETFSIPYLFISHSLLEMRLMVDHVLTIDQGRIVDRSTVENLARSRMGLGQTGYINMLKLANPGKVDGMCAYPWGGTNLYVSTACGDDGVFELSSREIMLIKQHPSAISARNLLECTVTDTFLSGAKVGVELLCGGETLVAEIVQEAAKELDIRQGAKIYAAIKASAFRRIFRESE